MVVHNPQINKRARVNEFSTWRWRLVSISNADGELQTVSLRKAERFMCEHVVAARLHEACVAVVNPDKALLHEESPCDDADY